MYINLMAKDKREMFFMNFDRKLVVNDGPEEEQNKISQ
jgi:hypothetical protein